MAASFNIGFPAIALASGAYLINKWWERNKEISDKRAEIYQDFLLCSHEVFIQVKNAKYEEANKVFGEINKMAPVLIVYATKDVLKAANDYSAAGAKCVDVDVIKNDKSEQEQRVKMFQASLGDLGKVIRGETIRGSFSHLIEILQNMKKMLSSKGN